MTDLTYHSAVREAYCPTCKAKPGERCTGLLDSARFWPPHGARLRFLNDLHALINALTTSPAPLATPAGEGSADDDAPARHAPGARGGRAARA